jgi:hypothetical protein
MLATSEVEAETAFPADRLSVTMMGGWTSGSIPMLGATIFASMFCHEE